MHPAALDVSESPQIRRSEGLDAEGAGFGDFPGGIDRVVHDHEDTLAPGNRARRRGHGIVQVQ